MAALESNSMSAGLLNHKNRKGSADLSLRKSLHSELKPALDDPELDQFWVATDEESDGDVPSRKAGRKVGPGQNASEQKRRPELGLVSRPEARVSVSNGPQSQRPTFATANGNVLVKEQGVQSVADGKRSTSDGIYLVESPTSVDLDTFSEVQAPRRSFEAGEYEKNLAKLREFERQTGVECPLEAREAGAVVTRVQRKVDRLGIQDGNQREQVARCILEAELGRAHASASLLEWDGVGQGLRQLVVEKDAELQSLRASTAEQKELEAACRAAERDAKTARGEAKTKVSEVEKLKTERDHLRLALSDAEMDLQSATNLLGEVKQGLAGKKEEEKGLEERLARRRSSVKLQERLQAAQEVIRVNEGVIRGLEEQLKGVKEGYVRERQQWVKDAIAQQSTIMEHIKDRETYAKAKEKEVKKLGFAVENARFEATGLKEEVARKDEELGKLRAQLGEREKVAGEEKSALESRVKEQTARASALEEQNRAQNAIIAGLEKLVDERTQVSVTVHEESESAKSQLAVSNQLVKSLKAQVASLQNELQMAKIREEGLRAASEKAGLHEARAAEVTTRVGVLEGEKEGLRKALEESEKKVGQLTSQQETVLVELKEREANVVAVKAQIQKLAEDAEAKLRATVADRETELSAQIVALEAQVRRSEAALERTAAEKEALEAEKRELLGVLQGRNNGQGSQELQRELPGVLQRQNDLGGSQERRRSLEIQGPSGEDFVGMLYEKEQLLSRTMSDALQKEEENRTLRREASEETAALATELQAAREEREKLQLRTEFLRKKVGELKEQAAIRSEKAMASVHARDAEVTRLRRELDGANRRAEQLACACRSLQTQLGHVGADVAPSGASGMSPTKRKRSRLDDPGAGEVSEGVREGLGVVPGGVSEGSGRVSELEAALVGKSKELRAKEAEVRGLQEILRVLARQLEDAEESPVKDGLVKENESGEDSEVPPVKDPANSPTGSLSRSIDGTLLTAMKNALRGASFARGNSLELSPAVMPRREPLDGSPGSLVATPATKERLALKRENRELYDRLERKEEATEERLRLQTEQYRSTEREVMAAWREREGELAKELEGRAAKLAVMEEAFQDLLMRLEEARTEAEGAVAGAKRAEQRAEEAEHACLMLKRRLKKLEEVDKTGDDGMWRELARLAAANAALEDRVAQLTTEPTSPALSVPSPQPRSSLQTAGNPSNSSALPATGSEGSPTGTGNGSKGSPTGDGNGCKGSPTGSSSGRDGVRLSNDVAANLSKAFGLWGLPSSSGVSGQPTATKTGPAGFPEANPTAASEARSPVGSENEGPSKRTVPEPVAPRTSQREQVKRPSTAGSLGPSPSTNSYEAARRSAPVSPATSPGGTARNAEELSNSVFDRLAVLRQRYAGEDSTDSPAPSPGDPPGWAQPAGTPSPGGNSAATSPGAASDKGAGSQDESAKQTKGGGGAIRNLVRWFETKVPSKKSPSGESSPAAKSPGYNSSPGGASPGMDSLRVGSGISRSASRDAPGAARWGPPGLPRSPSNELLFSDTQMAFARELTRLEVPGEASQAPTEVNEASAEAGRSPGATNVSPSSPGVRKRLEILRQRAALLGETSSSAEQSDEKPAGKGQGLAPRLGVGVARPRILLESNSSSEAGSPEPHRRTGSLRREERVSEGFGSPQANAVPAILSWIPPPEALARAPRVSGKALDVPTGPKPGDAAQRPGVSGKWEEAQGGIVGEGNSPSSVLERLAVLKSRGSPSLDVGGAA